LVITEILSQLFGEKALATDRYPSLRFESALKMLVERTEPGPNVPGQEERDNYFGRLFGLETFVKAGVLSNEERWSAVLDLILALSAKKVWIRSQCGWLITQAVGQMDVSTAKYTLERLAKTELVDTPEGVAVWLTAREKFPSSSRISKVEPWGDPLSRPRLNKLALVLREGSKNDSSTDGQALQGQPKQVGWTAQLHFVWDSIIRYLAGADEEALGAFWQTVVDGEFQSLTRWASESIYG
jgi:DNA polymerase phi